MTELLNNPPNNPTGNNTENTTHSNEKNTPAKRKQRIRGCGVPATVWFTPHPDNRPHHPETADPETKDGACGATQEWAVAETVRQFTAPGQHYSIIRISTPDFYTDDVSQASISRHRRTTTEGLPALDEEASIRAGHHLVAIVATDREEPDYEVVDYHRFRYGRPLATPGGTTLAVLIKGARRTLADGGILAVQLPRPYPGEEFSDESGAVIKDARRAGLVYLQHIALVDSYIDHEGITPALPQADLDAFWSARAQGVPVHARSHSDLLIFRKPEKENALA